MSVYLVPSGISERRLKSVASQIARSDASVVMEAGAAGYLWVGDASERFGPALDQKTGVRVVTSGRLVWPAHEWIRATHLPYQGGLANKLVLDRYLVSGPDAVAPYNGSAAITVYDPRDGDVHVWTDQFGYHPCFLYECDDAYKCIVTTFPDALLADPAVSVTYDLASMAEFVRAWRATPPHTYFNEVKHVQAASHTRIDSKAATIRRRTYWIPRFDDFFPSVEEAAEELETSVRAAISERTAISKKPLVFISGGADSRVLLFSAANRSRTIGAHVYEHETREKQIAQQLCRAAGCSFVGLQRDSDFYPRLLPEIVRWSGAMWSAEDAHYLGFKSHIADLEPDLVMTACTTDWLFKGYGLEKKHVAICGRNLPTLRYTNLRVDGFLPNLPLSAPEPLAPAIKERLDAWFADCPAALSTPRERLLVEDRRIRPASYTVSVSGSMMYRIYPYDTFLADARIADCYSRIHPDWKLNRELWGRVVARICGDAGRIVDANYGWRVDARMHEKLFVFAYGWITRRLTRTAQPPSTDRPPSSGSWPELGWYVVHSKTVKELWHSATADERQRMEAVTGRDPWRKTLDDWSCDSHQLFRLLTLLCHWRECDRRRGKHDHIPSHPDLQHRWSSEHGL